MDITKKYIAIKENRTGKENFLRVSVYYDLGGYNFFTHKEKKRGYYISVAPVELSTLEGVTMERVKAFTGYCNLLAECSRKSKKAEAGAIAAAAFIEKDIIDCVCNKYGYILEG